MASSRSLRAAAVVAAFGLAGCGGSTSEVDSASPSTDPPAGAATRSTPSTLPTVDAAAEPSVADTPAQAPGSTARSALPDLTVDDVAGGKVQLASLAPAAQPLLVWFWAPH